MDPEDKKLLKETFELSKKNHKLLRKIRRQQIWTRIYRIFYWLIIFALAFGTYYYVQPLIGKIGNLFGGLGSGLENIASFGQNLPDIGNLNEILDQVGGQ